MIDPNNLEKDLLAQILSSEHFRTDSPRSLLSTQMNQHRGIFNGLITIIFMVAVAVTLITDLSIHQRITWSFYTSLSITAAWALTILPLVYRKRSVWDILSLSAVIITIYLLLLDNHFGSVTWGWYPTISLAALTALFMIIRSSRNSSAAVSLLLFYLDLAAACFFFDLTTPGRWFFPLGLPLISSILVPFSIFLSIAIGTHISRYLKWLMASAAVIVSALLTDLTISLNMGTKPLISWSIIVAVCMLPWIIVPAAASLSPEIDEFLRKKFHV